MPELSIIGNKTFVFPIRPVRNEELNETFFFVLRKLGIFPQGLINYITTSGGGFNWPDSAEAKGRSMQELIESV